jgi:hypothetical protein
MPHCDCHVFADEIEVGMQLTVHDVHLTVARVELRAAVHVDFTDGSELRNLAGDELFERR